jgi:sugar/nucleoside kinase (ribokinase family)
MSKEFDAVVAGYVGVDLAPSFAAGEAAVPLAQLLRPGKLIEVGPLAITPGGVVPNTGLAMAGFGCRVALMGLLGADRLGDLLLGLLEGRGAALHLRRTDTAGTAYGFVIAPPGTDRVFLESPGCNATFRAADVDYDLVARSRLFHFGYPPLMPGLLANDGDELAAMFSRVRALGVATSLDMTLPDPEGASRGVDWGALLVRVLPHVDVFAPSLEELLYMLAPAEWSRLASVPGEHQVAELVPEGLCADLAGHALSLGAAIVLVKAGARGGYLGTTGDAERLAATGLSLASADWTDRRFWLPAVTADPARVCNTCGAGDAAVAGFLTAILRGENAATAGRVAMLAGRDSLYGVDTTAGLVTWEQMLRPDERPANGQPPPRSRAGAQP